MDENKGKTAYFGGIQNAKFRQKVVPGDTLRLEVTLDRIRPTAGMGTAVAYKGGKAACSCGLTFAIER